MDAQTILLWVCGQLVVGAAIWGGIRSDIRGIHRRQELNETSTSDAHNKINRHVEWHLGSLEK